MRSILYVDDDSNDRLFFSTACEEAGLKHEVKLAEDGEQAKRYLVQAITGRDPKGHPLPELVVMDIKMPQMTGLEVLAWLRGQKALQPLPVIMFSSSAVPGDIVKSYRLGANAFVTKPCDFAQMVEVAAFVGQWLKMVRHPLGPESSEGWRG